MSGRNWEKQRRKELDVSFPGERKERTKAGKWDSGVVVREEGTVPCGP